MKTLFLLIFSTLQLFVFGQSEVDKHEFELLFKSSNTDGSCYRIPAIATMPNGDIIALCDQRIGSCGDLKFNKDINIVMKRSKDNGKTWSEMDTLVDYPYGQSASDPSLIVDEQTGCVFLFYNFMDLVEEPGVFYLKYVKSCDNGNTWSKPVDISSQITKAEWHNDFKFITSGRGLQVKSGKLLHTLVVLNKGVFVFYSNDHGDTWSFNDVPVKPADESKIIELSNGEIMINSRANGLGYRYIHLSNDDGKTWKSFCDSSLNDPGCNASILNYNDTLLFANLDSNTKRQNLSLKLSSDNGKTWKILRTIYPESSAYSSICRLPGGGIGVLFEKDDYTEIVFVKITDI